MAKRIEKIEYLTTGEVADRLGVSRRRVRQFIEAKRLPAEKFGRDYQINPADLPLVGDRKPGNHSREPRRKN